MFITIEGPDFVGKTTVINELRKVYPDALYIREPGTTASGEKIREILLHAKDPVTNRTQLLLFIASFSETCDKVIIPALADGKMVVGDRWYYSTAAYQIYSSGTTKKELLDRYIAEKIFTKNLGFCNVCKPDINFILSVSWGVILDRMKNTTERDNFESKDLEFRKRVYEYYENDCDGIRIDATGTPQSIVDAIIDCIDKCKKYSK